MIRHSIYRNQQTRLRTTRAVALSVMLAVASGAVGCGGDDGSGSIGSFNLSFKGSEYAPHESQSLFVTVVDLSTNATIKSGFTKITNGAFSFSWADVLRPGRSYRIDYYADVNGNSECEDTDDHVWSETVNAVSDDVVVSVFHNLSFAFEACDSFKDDGQEFQLTFTGSGYAPHNGQTLSVAIVRVDQGRVKKTAQKVLTDGTFSFSWDSVLEAGESYYIDFFADVDGNGRCDAATDHVWRVSIPAVTGDVTVSEEHNLNFEAAACQSFATTG